MIKPFEKAAPKPFHNKIATRKWVSKFFDAVLKKLHFTGEGIELSSSADGQVNIKVTAGADAADHPFKVSVSDNKATVAAGEIWTWLYATSPSTLNIFSPQIPAQLSGLNGYIVLRMKHSKLTGDPILPWTVQWVASLSQTPLIRAWGTEPGRDADTMIPLAKIIDGEPTQYVKTHLSIQTDWNNVVICRV